MGPLIDLRQRDRVEGYVQSALDEAQGSSAAGLARRDSTEERSTSHTARRRHARDAGGREEIFGPVLVAIPYDDDDDAVRIANDSIYGLSGHVFGADDERALAVARRIRTGTMSVNGGVWYSADVPFGGYRQSGIGREMGVAGFEEYLETKALARPASGD